MREKKKYTVLNEDGGYYCTFFDKRTAINAAARIEGSVKETVQEISGECSVVSVKSYLIYQFK
jgi:hypothetical protein